MSINLLRRPDKFDRAVGITGGNIVTVAKKLYRHKWSISHTELARFWKDVNIYTDPALLRGKCIVFVLPERDKLIDNAEVLGEIELQNSARNTMRRIKRSAFSHIGIILEETVPFPKQILGYIDAFKQPVE